MKLSLWSIGKPNERYVYEGIMEFTQRVARYFPVEWTIIPPVKEVNGLSEAGQKQREAEKILQMLQPDFYLVVLDQKGKQMTSAMLASFLQKRASEATKNIVFLIGGVYGLSQQVLDKADLIWSLSQLTFPHQLVRLILAEQLYRACTILRNEKYHHK